MRAGRWPLALGSSLIAWSALAGEPRSVTLEPLGGHREQVTVGEAAACRQGTAGSVAYDPTSRRLFVTNPADRALDIFDIADPRGPELVKRVPLAALTDGADLAPTGVAAADGLVAVAAAAVQPVTAPGRLLFVDVGGRLLRSFDVGAGPSMLTFTPDGEKLVAAIEGEPDGRSRTDPAGGIAIVDLRAGIAGASLRRAGFAAFNREVEELRAAGVRIFGPGASVAQDVEPEHVAVSQDSRAAFVTLQENNAIAVVDLERGAVVDIFALGLKDHARVGAGLDASDRDGGAFIAPWPLSGLYQPGAIAAYRVEGRTYLVTANGGKSRPYEVARVAELTLDPAAFPDAEALQRDDRLGRLEVSTVGADPDRDGDVDRLLPFGGRSLAIWSTSGKLVTDTGDRLERVTARPRIYLPAPNLFNTGDRQNRFDDRSDEKGPEPTGLAIGEIDGRPFAFTGLATGFVAAFDVGEPARARLMHLVPTRDFAVAPDALGEDMRVRCAAGDLGPEDILFIPESRGPDRTALLAVTFRTSGSFRLFAVRAGRDED